MLAVREVDGDADGDTGVLDPEGTAGITLGVEGGEEVPHAAAQK